MVLWTVLLSSCVACSCESTNGIANRCYMIPLRCQFCKSSHLAILVGESSGDGVANYPLQTFHNQIMSSDIVSDIAVRAPHLNQIHIITVMGEMRQSGGSNLRWQHPHCLAWSIDGTCTLFHCLPPSGQASSHQ